MRFIFYTPFTGLGLYHGFRGNRWLRNRIKIFKQFVIPSLLNQTDRDFLHWISWRKEEKNNRYVRQLEDYLSKIPNYKFVFTYGNVCFYDDKYPRNEAIDRLADALLDSTGTLLDHITEPELCVMIQPSDDLYSKQTVSSVKEALKNYEAVSYRSGYIANYLSKNVLEYNPNTNPPFYAIKFKREIFFDIPKHMAYTSLKRDVGEYPKGTPQPSHEYLPDCFNTCYFDGRGFLVGTHGENISTHFNHPFRGREIRGYEREQVLDLFGISQVEPLSLPKSLRKWIIRKLPFKWQKRLRYLWGEKVYNLFYNWIRN